MKKLIFLSTILAMVMLTTSCGSDGDDTPENCSVAYSQAFEDELTNITNATQVYSTDPTPANCQAFKDAYSDYLDALEDWENCAIFYNQTAQWQQGIDAARASLDDIMC